MGEPAAPQPLPLARERDPASPRGLHREPIPQSVRQRVAAARERRPPGGSSLPDPPASLGSAMAPPPCIHGPATGSGDRGRSRSGRPRAKMHAVKPFGDPRYDATHVGCGSVDLAEGRTAPSRPASAIAMVFLSLATPIPKNASL